VRKHDSGDITVNNMNPDYQTKQAELIREYQLTRLMQATEIIKLNKEIEHLKNKVSDLQNDIADQEQRGK